MITDTNTQDNNMDNYFFRASAEDFKKIPSSPVAYWVEQNTRKSFSSGSSLGDIAPVRQGLATADNDRFLRLWYEIDKTRIGFGYADRESASESNKKWFPYNKGGDFRKWYGNNEYVINWEKDGFEINEFKPRAVIRNPNYYFKKSITWSFVSSAYFGVRYSPQGAIFDVGGSSAFPNENDIYWVVGFLCSKQAFGFMKIMNPTLNFQVGNVASLPVLKNKVAEIRSAATAVVKKIIQYSKTDWDSYETSWDFTTLPLLHSDYGYKLSGSYAQLRAQWQENTQEMQRLEEENNRIFIDAYGLQDELTPEVPLTEITLTCNPHYRYRLGKQWDEASEEERNAELERQLQSDTLCELISYAVGCMMGRYSIDQPGLILASQGETLQDYLERVPNPRFLPDDDAIVPLTDQEWFADDATHRVREFVRTVWGEQHLQENLDFIAESLCLSAIRPRKGESSLDCIRRYLSTQFYKDHMRTYKKRPIYWLFSSGKLKAFECLVYLHRYTEGTLARMRTEYVIPLTARLHSHGERLEEARANSTSAAETKRLEKELDQLHKQQAELAEFDEQLRHYADQRIRLDLDDGVKVNYGKFGNLLADVKAIVG